MTKRWFLLDVNPEPWEIGPLNVVRKNSKYIPFVGRSQQLHDYKLSVQEALRKATEKSGQEIVMMEGKIKLTFFFWRQRADYTTWQSRRHRKHEADVTNLIKATEDALQGILFGNDRDSRVVYGHEVEQSPDAKSNLVICIEPAPTTEEILQLLPPHILAALEETPELPIEDDRWSRSNPGGLF